MSEPINGDELLAKIKPQFKEVRTEVCLRPDLIEQWSELNAALAAEQGKTAGRLSDGTVSPEAKKLAKKITAVETEIVAASMPFTFRALPIDEYQSLCTEHPPRKDVQFDHLRGYNLDAVAEALVRRCLVDPVFTDDGWDKLRAALGRSEWDELRNAAAEANGGAAAPPKSALALRVLGKSDNASS